MANQSKNKPMSVRFEPALRAKVAARGGAAWVRQAVEKQLAFEEMLERETAIWAAKAKHDPGFKL